MRKLGLCALASTIVIAWALAPGRANAQQPQPTATTGGGVQVLPPPQTSSAATTPPPPPPPTATVTATATATAPVTATATVPPPPPPPTATATDTAPPPPLPTTSATTPPPPPTASVDNVPPPPPVTIVPKPPRSPRRDDGEIAYLYATSAAYGLALGTWIDTLGPCSPNNKTIDPKTGNMVNVCDPGVAFVSPLLFGAALPLGFFSGTTSIRAACIAASRRRSARG